MHETSIVQNLVAMIDEQIASLGDVRVKSVGLRVGPLAGVVSDALQFAFRAASPGTAIEGARLDIEHVDLTVWCRICLSERILSTPQKMRCPICDRPTPDIIGGNELEFAWLEVIDIQEAIDAV
jgi:hydrogenase nickel incorporation protein HypA/HybF